MNANQQIILNNSMLKNNEFHIDVELPSEVAGETRVRTLKLSGRSGWKQAHDEACEQDTVTALPRYIIRVDKFPFVKGNYNGTGAMWYRDNTFASGTFKWRDAEYIISRAVVQIEVPESINDETGEITEAHLATKDVFTLKLAEVEEMLAA